MYNTEERVSGRAASRERSGKGERDSEDNEEAAGGGGPEGIISEMQAESLWEFLLEKNEDDPSFKVTHTCITSAD